MIFNSKYPPLNVPNKDVLSFIFDEWKHDWNKPLFIDAENPDSGISASQMINLIKRIGKGLRDSLNVHTGDVVMLCTSNSIFIPALMLGAICAGATISGANPNSTVTELIYQIKDTGSRVIFASEESLGVVSQTIESFNLPSTVVLASLERGPKFGVMTVGDLLNYGELQWDRLTTEMQMRGRIFALNYSSGTTGPPKGCKISVFNMMAYCCQEIVFHNESIKGLRASGKVVPDTETDIAFAPFYHALGQVKYCIVSQVLGSTTYVMKTFNFEKFLDYIPLYRITSFVCVPPIAVALAKHPRVLETDFSSVHSALCGAAPLGKETQLQAEKAMRHPRLRQGWGMSEAVCGVTGFLLHERDPDISGVGYLLPSMSARIVDDQDQDLGWNEAGEVLIKGPNVFEGYWNKDAETRDAFLDGWYRTGDIGVMKRDGILHIVDRKKELIKVRGFQVAPAELEGLLLKHPDVADAAVIGIPIEGTELPRAYIVPSRPGVDPRFISEYIASKLVYYKQLTGGIVFVDDIPKNPSGKILRRLLRERAKEDLKDSRQSIKAKL